VNSIYKSASEAAALLHERYSGPMKAVRKAGGQVYDYIPWNESARQLDKVFGIFGWDSQVVALEAHPTQGIYTAAVAITARVLDDETGNIISITRSAVGRGSASPTREERDRGIEVAENLGAHDTAAAAAGSDAFSRAAKLLGDAFGLFLYDKEETTASAGYTPAQRPATTTATTNRGPSPKQMAVLIERGYTEAQIAGLSFPQWKGVLDAIFDHQQPAILPAGMPQERETQQASRTVSGKPTAIRKAAVVQEEDEVPF